MKKYLFPLPIFIIIICFLYGIIPFSTQPASCMRIIAHRGDSMNAPENSIPAVLSAIENEADCIEIDIRCTADHTPVVFHDATLRRMTGIPLSVSELTCQEFLSYPLTRSKGYSSYPRTTACTLKDILLVVSGQSGLCLHIELKSSGIEKQVVSLLQKYDSRCSYQISSTDPAVLEKIKDLSPDIHTCLILKSTTDVINYLLLSQKNIDAISVKSCYITSPLVYFAHKRGHKIYAWTVNKAPAARRLSRLKIDGIITDDPALLRKMLS